MNRIYKVVYSKIKHCYVVANEFAKANTKSSSQGSTMKGALLTLAVLTALPMAGGVFAATNLAPTEVDVVAGKDAGVSNENFLNPQHGSVAIGENADVANIFGGQEFSLSMGMGITYPGSIAIGQNSYARSGSVQIGIHNYEGAMGDITVTDATNREGPIVDMTILGTNSYGKAPLGTITGAYSIISGKYTGKGDESAIQNFGASIVGSLNSIESAHSDDFSAGLANSIVGVANKAYNSNGSLIFGAGNNIENSIQSSFDPTAFRGAGSAADLQKALMQSVRDSNGGGSVMAIGGGNTANWTVGTQIIGLNNTVTGTEGNVSKNNLIFGRAQTATDIHDVLSFGGYNTLNSSANDIVIGENRTLTSADNNVLLGIMDKETAHNVSGAVAVGHNAQVDVAGGVAIGEASHAIVAEGVVGYDPATKTTSTETNSTWKSTAASVSVGDVEKGITRQITNVAAGANDTDAVNVAQLKEVTNNIDNLGSSVNRLDTRINKVGAGAAALAALHPLDFNPSDKWDFAAGIGNYRDANSVAVGAFYRPNEDTMFSIGGSFGNGENMINAGVSLKFGNGDSQHSYNSNNIRDLQQKVTALQTENQQIKARDEKLAADNEEMKKKIDLLMQKVGI